MKTSLSYADLGFEITTTIDEEIIGLQFEVRTTADEALESEIKITIVEDITE